MDTLIQKFFEKNIKKTWDGCSYDLDNPTEEFYYNLKTSLDDLKHEEKKEREPSEFFKAIYQDPKNQKTASYNTKEIYIKNDKKSIDSIKESDNIDLFKTVLTVKNESKTSKKKSLVEAFSEEELDMDEEIARRIDETGIFTSHIVDRQNYSEVRVICDRGQIAAFEPENGIIKIFEPSDNDMGATDGREFLHAYKDEKEYLPSFGENSIRSLVDYYALKTLYEDGEYEFSYWNRAKNEAWTFEASNLSDVNKYLTVLEDAYEEAKEKAAHLAKGELTKDEKRSNIKINCKYLQKYIDSMENDLKDTFQKLMGNQTLHFGNPIGFEPRGGDMVYDFNTFPMWTEIKTPFGEDETNNQLSSDFCYTTEYGKYPACIVYYPTISLDSLTFQMTGDPVEADMFHSGSRNKKDWKVYFVYVLKTLESEEQIHDIFDSDAELFACVKWIMYEQFGVMVAASCINSTKTIAEACKAFGETPYAQESRMGNNAWFFGQFLTGLVSEEQQAEIMR